MTTETLRQAVERHHERLLEVYGRAFLCEPPTASMDSLSEVLDDLDALLAEPPSEVTESELRAIIRNAIALNDPAATAQWMRDHLHVTRRG